MTLNTSFHVRNENDKPYNDFVYYHLAYMEPRWYGSQISADCQQNLLSLKHGTSGRYLLVNFLRNRKERTTHREGNHEKVETTCLLENGRDFTEIKSFMR